MDEPGHTHSRSPANAAWLGVLTVLVAGSLGFLGYAALAKWRELSASSYAESPAPSARTVPAQDSAALAKGGTAPRAQPRPSRLPAAPAEAPGDFGAAAATGERRPRVAEPAPPQRARPRVAQATAAPVEAPRRASPRPEPARLPRDEAARRLEALGAKLQPDHFQFAVAHGDLDQVKIFLQAGFSPNQKLANQEFSVFYLTLIGLGDPKQEAVAIEMLDYGADLEVRTPTGLTPLMMAAIQCRPRFAQAVAATGVALEAADPQGATALAWARRSSCASVLELLERAGARR